MKEYIYTGPLSGVSLKGHGDVMLHPGSAVLLPDGHGYTERLIRKGWLHETGHPKTEKKSAKKAIEEVTADAS